MRGIRREGKSAGSKKAVKGERGEGRGDRKECRGE